MTCLCPQSTGKLVPCTPETCFASVTYPNGTTLAANQAVFTGGSGIGQVVNPHAGQDAMSLHTRNVP